MDIYPLFPLQIVVYPLEQLNLHIFEHRYRELIKDCQELDLLFGIPTYRKGHSLDYGSLIRLVKIEKQYPDGRLDIRTEGVQVIRVKKYLDKLPQKLYPGGELSLIDLDLELDHSKCDDIKEMLSELYSFMSIKDIPKALGKETFYTTQIAHKVGFNTDQEYYFLQLETEIERQDYMLDHLDKLVPMARSMEEMRKKIQLNGHFKDILPPEV